MKAHITGFFWTLNRKATPFLKLRCKEGNEQCLALKRNTTLEIKKEYSRFCTGYFSKSGHHECNNRTEIIKGQQCLECSSKDDYLTCAKCRGVECLADEESMKKCLNTTHFLYITLIGDLLKVGVTKSNRYMKRWIEQGSDYSCIISSGNGIRMKNEEFMLAKELKDRLFFEDKIKNFKTNNPEILRDYLKSKKINAPIINVRKYYEGIDSIPSAPHVSKELIKGRIVCVKGKILVTEKDKKYFFHDLNKIISKVVDINHI